MSDPTPREYLDRLLDDPAAPAIVEARTVTLADVEPESVEWLWQDYIPLGKVTVLDGDPGLGKSTILLDLAARVTTATPLPDGSPPGVAASDVVLLTAEDGLADTVRPRFDAAGGDPARMHVVVDVVTRVDERLEARLPTIPADVDALAAVVARTRARLVIVDVLAAYLGAEINSFRDQDVRRALHPLARMAEVTGATVIVLRHLNKTAGGTALYRGGGSIGIAGAARSVLMVGDDPDVRGRRVLASVKSNLAPTPPSLGYRLVGHPAGCAVVVWEGPVERRADELVIGEDGDERSAVSEAERFLIATLTDASVPSRDVLKSAAECGIAKRTLDRAKRKIGVTSAKTSAGHWEWTLNGDQGR
jgi:AAA domain